MTQKVRQGQVTDDYGRPVPGAEIYVTDTLTLANANLTVDGAVALAQPVVTDEFGIYTYWANEGFYREDIYFGGKLRYREMTAVGVPPQFKGDPGGNAMAIGTFTAAPSLAISNGFDLVRTTGFYVRGIGPADYIYDPSVDAAYVTAHPRTSFRDANGRGYKVLTDAGVTPQQLGATGDGIADDGAILQTWLDLGGNLSLPVGEYYSSIDLILRKSAVIEGEGYGFDNRIVDGTATQGYENQPGSRIHFAAGKGLIGQPQTTQTDETATIVVSQEGAFDVVIRNLALVGAGTGATATGFYCRTVVHLDNVHAYKFTGKGFDISAVLGPGSDPTAEYGNASLSTLRNCRAIGNGSHGFHVRGVDANVVKFDNCNAQLNGGWGFLDESFLGSTYIGGQAATNTLGSYKCIGNNAPSAFNGCYVETGTGQAPDLSYLCVVHGGVLASFARQFNVGTNGHPTITGGTGVRTGKLTLVTPQDLEGAITDHCVLYRHADEGLVLQGVPSPGGTYSHAFRNAADESVLLLHAASKALYAQGPLLIAGSQVVGPQHAAIPGGAYSVVAPTQTEFNALVDVVNAFRLMFIYHGLIAP